MLEGGGGGGGDWAEAGAGFWGPASLDGAGGGDGASEVGPALLGEEDSAYAWTGDSGRGFEVESEAEGSGVCILSTDDSDPTLWGAAVAEAMPGVRVSILAVWPSGNTQTTTSGEVTVA